MDHMRFCVFCVHPDFNRVKFDAFRIQASLNSFVMTP